MQGKGRRDYMPEDKDSARAAVNWLLFLEGATAIGIFARLSSKMYGNRHRRSTLDVAGGVLMRPVAEHVPGHMRVQAITGRSARLVISILSNILNLIDNLTKYLYVHDV